MQGTLTVLLCILIYLMPYVGQTGADLGPGGASFHLHAENLYQAMPIFISHIHFN